jgi:large subunit ribosomal protein L31
VKESLHPQLHLVTAICACGNTFQTHSTKNELRLEICSECHPYFTGKQKLVDTAGRVERFRLKYKGAEA